MIERIKTTNPYSGESEMLTPEEYKLYMEIKIAEINEVNICFLEHYELYSIETDKNNPFHNGNIDNYLEELDELKETYDFIFSGLEVEYYGDREIELLEFMDDYEKELDFIGGTLHEWIFGYPVTTKKKLLELLNRKKMRDVIDEYFELSENYDTLFDKYEDLSYKKNNLVNSYDSLMDDYNNLDNDYVNLLDDYEELSRCAGP